MASQFLKYTGGLMNSDSNNVAGALMERANDGTTNANGITLEEFVETLGALYVAGKSYSATVTLDATATVIKLNAASAAFTATLPPVAASSSLNQIYMIIKTDSSGNLPTIKGNASETINGANTYTGLSAQFKAVLLWCDGTQWLILANA